jgi:hypothetical protein
MREPTADELAALTKLAADPQPVLLEMSKLQSFILLGMLQLVTRHPDLPDTSRAVAVGIARTIQSGVLSEPPLSIIAEMGWDQANDVDGGAARMRDANG